MGLPFLTRIGLSCDAEKVFLNSVAVRANIDGYSTAHRLKFDILDLPCIETVKEYSLTLREREILNSW